MSQTARTLLLIPVVRPAGDSGPDFEKFRDEYIKHHGASGWDTHSQSVSRLWGEIRTAIASLLPLYRGMRLYQEGLPECGREVQIVQEQAARGSKDHQLLLDLIGQGALLMGTEDPQHLRPHPSAKGGQARRDASAERDRHIAERINATLQPGEIGVLLLGPAREVQALLASDIIVKKVMSLPSQSW